MCSVFIFLLLDKANTKQNCPIRASLVFEIIIILFKPLKPVVYKSSPFCEVVSFAARTLKSQHVFV